MKLGIISHTEHFQDSNGKVLGWGPTIRELNSLVNEFDEIYHFAPLYKCRPPLSALTYESERIHHIPLIPSGGKSFIDKIKIVFTIPQNLRIINKHLKKVDIVQFRSPTNLGIYVLPYLSYFNNIPRWVKYAGNWDQKSPPLSYRFQRWWLKNNFQGSKVTINGKWQDDPSHVLPLENPCINENELKAAHAIAIEKNYNGKLNICFVGRIEEAKGVGRLIRAIGLCRNNNCIESVFIVGDGVNRKHYEQEAIRYSNKIIFTGPLSRVALNEIYAKSHIFCLPSFASEGFPKVIAEAAAYGCIPVVSEISSIPQFVKNDINGIVMKDATPFNLAKILEDLLNNRNKLVRLSIQAKELANDFTYEKYNKAIMNKIVLSMNE